MAQTRFQYDYSGATDARKSARRYKPAEQWAWVVLNPASGRYVVLFGDQECDGPTRVKPVYTFEPDPVYVHEHSDSDRMAALVELVERGVIVIHAVNIGYDIDAESLGDLCDEWIENAHIDWSTWERDS